MNQSRYEPIKEAHRGVCSKKTNEACAYTEGHLGKHLQIIYIMQLLTLKLIYLCLAGDACRMVYLDGAGEIWSHCGKYTHTLSLK